MDEEKKDYKDLLEKIAEDNTKDLIYLLLGSLISADTIVDIDTCRNSMYMLTELKYAIERVSESLYTREEKDKLLKFCNEGIEVCKQDLEQFENNSNLNNNEQKS